MLVTFTLSEPRALEADEFDALNAIVVEDLERHPEDAEYEHQRNRLKGYMYTADAVELLEVLPKGFEATIQGEASVSLYVAIWHEIRQIKRKILLLDTRDEPHPQQHNRMYNDNHIANESLLRIKETRVFDDCCTESIDKKLTEGWRILAVCPQPDQRRPDYILGRMERNEDDD